MPDHAARFPGISNDPEKCVLTARQASRLAALAAVPAAELTGKTLGELGGRLRRVIDPKLLIFRKICGQVVKTDASGRDLPVPFATVTVFDVDLGLLGWSPVSSMYSWFFPLFVRREKLATVTTDECGRFCVWVPRFDVDFYLRWRVERQGYLPWLRRPTVADVLREREVIPRPQPQPDPPPLRLDEHVLAHAGRVIEAPALSRLREVAGGLRPGAPTVKTDEALLRPAFSQTVRAPLTAAASEALAPALRAKLAARVGVPQAMLANLDAKRGYGPFLRPRVVLVPEWTAVLDVPDLAFEVTQDVNGDGVAETIYREGLFDVRWDASGVSDVTLHADPIAVTSPGCDIPEVGPCGDPAILFAGNYPLQVPGNPSEFHDGASGYALLPNRPDENGLPYEGARTEPAQAPFAGSFYLVGCAERPDATHYRVHHQVDGGGTTFLSGSFGPLAKVVGGTLQQRVVSPLEGQWYPIVPRAEGWTPVGILAPVVEGGDHLHTFSLEFGRIAGGAVTPIAGSKTSPVNVRIDGTSPTVEFLALQWRQPEVSLAWQPLPVADCAVVPRSNASRVQFRLAFGVSADHLLRFAASSAGCGPAAAPALITDGRDGLPVAAADAAAHWHTGPGDNAHVRDLYFELPAGAPAGCYRFNVYAASRAFMPTSVATGPTPAIAWRLDSEPIWVNPLITVAVQ